MTVTTNITKIFNSDNITGHKYDLLYEYAVLLRDYKNKISNEFFNNLDFYMDTENIKNKYAFVSYMRSKYKGEVNCYYDGPLYELIYNNYKLRQESIIKQLKFNKREYIRFELYKRDCKNGKKGLLKQIIYKNHETDLSKTLTYLSKCNKPLDLNKVILRLQDTELDGKTKEKLIGILRCIDKFGYDRLWNLSQQKRQRILSYYNKPIEYKSLTFDGKVLKPYFIKRNNNHNSIVSTFATIVLPGYTKEITKNNKTKIVNTLDIPVKMSSKYHVSRLLYIKSPNKSGRCSYKFKILFDEYNKLVNILYCLDNQEKQIPEHKTKFVGIDVNLKHNLFRLSIGETYDYDRELLSKYLDELNKIDNYKKQNKNYVISKKRLHKLDILKMY